MEVPAPAGILRTAACKLATLSENGATWVTFSSKEKTERRSPGRNTWRMKWAAASCSKVISLWALRLASIMIARSSDWRVSDSNLSIFCWTPSSKSWKDSRGRSGAGRLCSSRTLTRTLTRLTVTRMRPRWAAGSCESSVDDAGAGADGGVGWMIFPGSPVGDETGLDLETDLDFCAQGGRFGLSCAAAVPIKRNARTASGTVAREQRGVIS